MQNLLHKLPKRKLGNTNLELSLIGLGTVKFGRNTAVKYPESFTIPSIDQIIKILELAQELGINTLDTAPAYGDSESKLGKIFKESSSIFRDNFKIITKAGEEFINNQSNYNFSADFISSSLDKSLKNLNTDSIDIFLIHSDGNDDLIANNDQLWQLLEFRKKQGDIKAYGVSSKTVENGGLECLKKADLAMVTYRKDYLEEKPLLDYALKNNKGIILKKVLNSGHLANNNSSATDCLKFSSQHQAVSSMIIGSINPKHIIQNISSLC